MSNMDGEGWFDLYTVKPDGQNLEHVVDAYGDQHTPHVHARAAAPASDEGYEIPVGHPLTGLAAPLLACRVR